jgi:hypothetical protein
MFTTAVAYSVYCTYWIAWSKSSVTSRTKTTLAGVRLCTQAP